MQYDDWLNWRKSLKTDKLFVEVYGEKQIEILSDDCRAFWIFCQKGTQKDKVSIVRKQLEIHKPELFLDIGANYGEFTAAVSSLKIKTICIEPNPRLVECLRTSFKDDEHITVIEGAAGDTNSGVSREFTINRNYSGGSSFSEKVIKTWNDPRYSQIQNENCETIKVYVINLVELIKDVYGKIPDSIFVKMDVEGFEDEVMDSLKEMLDNVSWWRVLYEYNEKAIINSGKVVDEWNKIFSGYNFYGDYNGDILIGNGEINEVA